MIYLLLFLVAAAILLYVTSRWLRAELRELRAWLGEKWTVRRGGESQASIIAAARHAFDAQGLEPHFMIVSRQVLHSYRQLRRHHIEQTPRQPLPAAAVLALAVDADARQLYLRAVIPDSGGPARDVAEFLHFDEIESVQAVPHRTPDGPAPTAERALEIVTTDPNRPAFHFALEPDWSVSADEITHRIRALLAGDWRPDAPPTVVR